MFRGFEASGSKLDRESVFFYDYRVEDCPLKLRGAERDPDEDDALGSG